jgi:hypothetical protein
MVAFIAAVVTIFKMVQSLFIKVTAEDPGQADDRATRSSAAADRQKRRRVILDIDDSFQTAALTLLEGEALQEVIECVAWRSAPTWPSHVTRCCCASSVVASISPSPYRPISTE